MTLVGYKFRPALVPTLAVLLAVPLFLGLGIWQLDRADQKRELAAALAERDRQPPLTLDRLLPAGDALRYRKAVATGRFEEHGQVLIENRKHAGRNGYHVITPLRIDGTDVRLLVNRGWVPMALEYGAKPDTPTPRERVTVSGTVDFAVGPTLRLGGSGGASGWRRPYLSVSEFAAGATYPVEPFVLLQDPADGHGFARAWPRPNPVSGMHTGYAIQWFAFALIALAIWVRLGLQRAGGKE